MPACMSARALASLRTTPVTSALSAPYRAASRRPVAPQPMMRTGLDMPGDYAGRTPRPAIGGPAGASLPAEGRRGNIPAGNSYKNHGVYAMNDEPVATDIQFFSLTSRIGRLRYLA